MFRVKIFTAALAVLVLFAQGLQAQEVAPPDTTKEGYPYYTNVNVEINYGWGDPEVLKGVNVIIRLEKKIPVAVMVEKPGEGKVEVFLRYKVVVRIYDRISGRLLRTLRAPEVAT